MERTEICECEHDFVNHFEYVYVDKHKGCSLENCKCGKFTPINNSQEKGLSSSGQGYNALNVETAGSNPLSPNLEQHDFVLKENDEIIIIKKGCGDRNNQEGYICGEDIADEDSGDFIEKADLCLECKARLDGFQKALTLKDEKFAEFIKRLKEEIRKDKFIAGKQNIFLIINTLSGFGVEE